MWEGWFLEIFFINARGDVSQNTFRFSHITLRFRFARKSTGTTDYLDLLRSVTIATEIV
jgi:hypothetical protein